MPHEGGCRLVSKTLLHIVIAMLARWFDSFEQEIDVIKALDRHLVFAPCIRERWLMVPREVRAIPV